MSVNWVENSSIHMNKETQIAVFNWAFWKGIMPMGYDWRSDTWSMSDGEPYTTTLILREVSQDEHNNI